MAPTLALRDPVARNRTLALHVDRRSTPGGTWRDRSIL